MTDWDVMATFDLRGSVEHDVINMIAGIMPGDPKHIKVMIESGRSYGGGGTVLRVGTRMNGDSVRCMERVVDAVVPGLHDAGRYAELTEITCEQVKARRSVFD